MRWGIGSLVAACFLTLTFEIPSDRFWLDALETYTQKKLYHKLRELEKEVLLHGKDSLRWEKRKDVYWFWTDKYLKPQKWNQGGFFPQALLPLSQKSFPELYVEKRSYYYCFKNFSEEGNIFVFLPLYEVPLYKASFLEPKVYLGGVERLMPEGLKRDLVSSTMPCVRCISFKDTRGQVLFFLRLRDPQWLRLWGRLMYAVLFVVGGFGVLYAIYKRALQHGPKKVRWAAVAVLIGLRMAWEGADISTYFSSLDIFSSELVAIGPLGRSLGDIFLSFLTLIGLVKILWPLVPRLSPKIGLGILAVLVLGFLGLLLAILFNGHLIMDPSQLAQWDTYSWLFAVGFLCVSWELYGRIQRRTRQVSFQQRGWLLGLMVIFLGVTLLTEQILLGLGVCIVFVAGLFRISIPSIRWILGLIGWAFLYDGALSYGQALLIKQNLPFYALRNASLRDLRAEYVFPVVAEAILRDTSLWNELQPQEAHVPEEFLGQILEKHLIRNFQGYQFQIFALDKHFDRIDNQFNRRPLVDMRATRSYVIQTGATHLEFVSLPSLPSMYVGLIPCKWQGIPLYLQVEMIPEGIGIAPEPTRFLLSTTWDKRSSPFSFSYGLYERGKLIRQYGTYPFPHFYQLGTDKLWEENPEGYQYLQALSQNRFIYLYAEKRKKLDVIAALPILLLLGAGSTMLLRGRVFFRYVIRHLRWKRRWNYITFQLQILFAGSIGVSVVLILFVNLFMRQLYTEQLQQELRKWVSQLVVGYFSSDLAFTEALEMSLSFVDPLSARDKASTRQLIRLSSEVLGVDILVYDRQGFLYGSSMPQVYQASFIGLLIPREAYRFCMRNPRETWITYESVGNLKYWAGYRAIQNKNLQTVGIVRVPYVGGEEILWLQTKRFLGYVVNGYLLILSFFITWTFLQLRRLQRGLKGLEKQILRAQQTEDLRPIDWQKQDEIGVLVRAYNQMALRLQESRARLEENTRLRAQQELARQAAHEIKSALTPMKLHAQNLQRLYDMGNVSAERIQKALSQILNSIESLVRIATNFSHFAQQATPQLSVINLKEFLESHWDMHNPQGIMFRRDFPKRPVYVYADPQWLQQVLTNLFNNALQAIQNAQKGDQVEMGVIIEVHAVRLYVRDNGPGIPYEDQKRIFTFNFSTKKSGMGLGLAVSKKFVEAMGGRIYFSSTPGEGTTFYVELPRAELD
ncbi:MAG: sensor histidine kinase [Bacteroidia bacterium]